MQVLDDTDEDWWQACLRGDPVRQKPFAIQLVELFFQDKLPANAYITSCTDLNRFQCHSD